MSDINVRIVDKIKELDAEISQLAMAAIQSAEKGLSENAIEETLQSVVRQIIKKRIEKNDSNKNDCK